MIKSFDPKKDRIIIMDCSENPEQQRDLFKNFLEMEGVDVSAAHFYVRRNWNLNHGAHLDYLRLIKDGTLERPKFCFLLQDHYLNTNDLVKGDTIPSGFEPDLEEIEKLLSSRAPAVWYCARNGFRVSASVPENIAPNRCDNDRHYEGSALQSFCIDGGNFCVEPNILLKYFEENEGTLTKGDGSYLFCHVWETRLSKIMYDQNVLFYEASRGKGYTKIGDLLKDHPNPNEVWHYFYNFCDAYLVYGQDIHRYEIKLKPEYLRMIFYKLRHVGMERQGDNITELRL